MCPKDSLKLRQGRRLWFDKVEFESQLRSRDAGNFHHLPFVHFTKSVIAPQQIANALLVLAVVFAVVDDLRLFSLIAPHFEVGANFFRGVG